MQALESQSVSLFPSACFYSGVSIPGLHLVPHFYDYNKSRLKENIPASLAEVNDHRSRELNCLRASPSQPYSQYCCTLYRGDIL